jgi:putative FmdB family regulatory protein
VPIFEYECRTCGREFELLVRTGDVPACPSCAGRDLEKLLSLSAVSSDSTRKANITKARLANKAVQRDKAMAEIEEIHEHYGGHAQPKPLRKRRSPSVS